MALEESYSAGHADACGRSRKLNWFGIPGARNDHPADRHESASRAQRASMMFRRATILPSMTGSMTR